MKRIISIALFIAALFNVNLIASAADTDIEDVLCSAFVVMEGKSESLVKNYYEELSVPPVIENEKLYIAAQDLEKWGTSVNIAGNDVTVINGAYTIEMTVGENSYFVNNEIVFSEPFAKVINENIMISFEDFAKTAGLKYIKYNNMGAVIYGADADEELYDDIYSKISELKSKSIMAELYVSPTGNDSGTGSKSDPFKTINRAKAYVQNLISSGMTGDVYVYIAEGTYEETLEFVSSDSGKGQYRVYYKGYNGAPEITTGKEIKNWEEYNGNIYRAYIGESRNINVLTENGVMSKIARYPNEDYLYTTSGASSKSEFYYADELPEIADSTRVEAYCWGGGGNAWSSDTISVKSIDYENKHITLNASASYAMSQNSRFLLQGAIELLDSPGEFFYDGKYLYYYPVTLPIAEQKIFVPNGNSLITFTGSSNTDPVKNITLSGLNISVTERDITAVTLESARNIEIESCKILNAGKFAVQMKGYAVANRIEGCEITDIGAGGISMSNTNDGSNTLTMNGRNNEVINCHINGVGRLDGDTSGISIGTGYNLVKNCRIHDGKRMGINISSPRPGTLVGKTVDGVLLSRENVHEAMHSQNNYIMFCEIFDVMRDSQDGGAFYSWGGDYDNVVAYNYIHDTCSPFSFAFGIYIDDGSDRFTIKNNIVDTMKGYKDGQVYAAIFTKGSENKVINNIAANNEALYTFMTETMVAEPCDNLEYSKNIAYNSGNTGMYLHKSYGKKRMKAAENNIYYSADKIYGITGISGITDLYKWQSYMGNKFDQFSDIDTEPLFYDAENGDYRLKYNSEAFKNGIADVDKGEMGLTEKYPFAEAVTEGNIYLDRADKNVKGASLILNIGEELELNAYARSGAGYKESLQDAEFTVLDESIAKVQDGKLIGLAKGSTTITISAKGTKITYDVIVGDEATEIVVEGGEKMFVGDTQKINSYAVTSLGGARKANIKYKSSDESVATVDDAGNVTGISEGEVTISAVSEENGKALTSDINIKIAPTLIFSEGFEGEISDRWNISDKTSVMADSDRSYKGNQSLAITRTTGSASYLGDASVFGNYVYEFWMYDDLNKGTGVLELTGKNKDGGYASVLFGVKENAYAGSVYLGNDTNTTGVTRKAGWHQVVIDMTEDYKISIYIDGKLTSINRGSHNLDQITSVKIHNIWYAGGTTWQFNFDEFKIWNKLESVTMRNKNVDINALAFYDENGETHAEITAGKTVKAVLDIKNNKETLLNVMPVIAIYDDNTLKAAYISDIIEISAGENCQAEIKFTVPEEFKGLKYKIMLWEGTVNMKPVSEALSGTLK